MKLVHIYLCIQLVYCVCSLLSSTCHGCCIRYLSAMLSTLLCTLSTVAGIRGFSACCMDFCSPLVRNCSVSFIRHYDKTWHCFTELFTQFRKSHQCFDTV